MDTFQVTLVSFVTASGVVLAAWLCLIIYRGTLESREDDQLYLADPMLAKAQQEVVGRIERINPVIRSVMVTWILLAAISAGLWIWQGYKSF
ncbi:MAG TPA: hypothetical protein VKB26_08360 [Candidatus Acidoferrales bacterium]|nr:hypothetical protein [Candidatus Acidoferrales bacterium]